MCFATSDYSQKEACEEHSDPTLAQNKGSDADKEIWEVQHISFLLGEDYADAWWFSVAYIGVFMQLSWRNSLSQTPHNDVLDIHIDIFHQVRKIFYFQTSELGHWER